MLVGEGKVRLGDGRAAEMKTTMLSEQPGHDQVDKTIVPLSYGRAHSLQLLIIEYDYNIHGCYGLEQCDAANVRPTSRLGLLRNESIHERRT